MKKIYASLFAVCCAVAANAQVSVKQYLPAPMQSAVQSSAPHVMGAPLNDLAKGLDIYGATMVDKNHVRNWVHFTTGNPGHLEYHEPFIANDDFELWAMRCGAYVEGNYYAYLTRMYSLVEYSGAYIRLNVEDGTYTEITDMRGSQWTDNWPVIYDMDYDHSTKTLYGLARQPDNPDHVSSSLVEIDPATGAYEQTISDIGFYAAAMTVDYDGDFYFIEMTDDDHDEYWDEATTLTKCTMTKDGKLQQVWRERIKVNGEDYPVNYTNDLTVDYTTGDLYAALGNNQSAVQYLMKINPDTREVTRLGGVGTFESVCGLYMPFRTAEARTAPAMVTAISDTKANAGQSVTLSWTNPTTQWNREALTAMTNVVIERDGVQIATVDAAGRVGEQMQYTDNGASEGIHTYNIYATNADGKGVPTAYKAYAGADMPGEVVHLAVEKVSDAQVNLTWEKPAAGMRDGYYDEATLTYTITRYPDQKVVAEGLTTTNFQDKDLADYDAYSYAVKSVNAKGEGSTVTSQAVHAGHGVVPPYRTNFDSQTDADRWTVVDDDNGTTWQWDGANGIEQMQRFSLEHKSLGNDYLLSPKMHVVAGKTYRAMANIVGDYEGTYRIEFTQGAAANAASQEAFFLNEFIVPEKQSNYASYMEGTFVAQADGDIFVGLHDISPAGNCNTLVYDFAFEEVADYDLGIESADFKADAVVDATNIMTVTVKNRGIKDVAANSYKVVVYADGEIIGTKSDCPALAVDAAVDIKVTYSPVTAGKSVIYAKVELEGDGNAFNDESVHRTVNVNTATTDIFNVEVTKSGARDEIVQYESRTPFDFTYLFSMQQSIYHYDEIGVPGLITRLGYKYYTNDVTYQDGEAFDVVVFAGVTRKDYFTAPNDWIYEDDLVMEYAGKVYLEAGEYESEHLLTFDFAEPIALRPGDNLVIEVRKKGLATVDWPVMFWNFNTNTNIMRSLRYSGSTELDPDGNLSDCLMTAVPQIMLAIRDSEGVNTVTVDGGAAVSVSDGMLRVGDDVRSVCIYDGGGRLVAQPTVGGNMRLNIPAGVYLVRAITADGNVRVQKVCIK